MTNWNLILSILSYILVGISIVFIIFIYVSIFFFDKIVKKLAEKIKEQRRNVIRARMSDLSLLIQVTIGFGVALVLFSLSREGVQVMFWFFMGLIGITTALFLLVWKYVPLRMKLFSLYK